MFFHEPVSINTFESKRIVKRNYFGYRAKINAAIHAQTGAGFEARERVRFGNDTPKHQAVFILGAPRTGSTFLYQLVTNLCQVTYLDNLTHLYYRTPLLGLHKSYKRYANTPHNNYSSVAGATNRQGMHAPSECGPFWHNWVNPSICYVDDKELNSIDLESFKKTINAALNRYAKPLVFKNLNVAQRLHLLKATVPESKFIVIKRDPLFTAQSIYRIRQQLGIPDMDWWSVKPRNYKDLAGLEVIPRIVQQVHAIENQIDSDLAQLFNPEQIYRVTYTNVCTDPVGTCDRIRTFMGNTEPRKNALPPDRNFEEKWKLAPELREQFETEIAKLNWSIEQE